MIKKIILGIVAVVFLYYSGWGIWKCICHEYCPVGKSILLKKKTGKPIPTGHFADPKKHEAGTIKTMLGPGTYWDISPWAYDTEFVEDVVIKPLEVALVTNRLGEKPSPGRVTADPNQAGPLVDVWTAGSWRINPHEKECKTLPARQIKPGYIGVQTYNEDYGNRKQGIQDGVLHAGIYPNNPVQRKIDEIWVGFDILEIKVEVDPNTSLPVPGTGVSFPLADGLWMQLDVSICWGIEPKQGQSVIKNYGNLDEVEEKIIIPRFTSICKNTGSNNTSNDFMDGEFREKYQADVTGQLVKIGEEKGLIFKSCLIRGFYVNENIKKTVQAKVLAEEETITQDVEKQKETMVAALEEAKRLVQITVNNFDTETNKFVETEREKGEKKVASIKENANRQVASLLKQAAEVEKQRIEILGKAEADVIQATKEADADLVKRLVAAHGSPEAFNMAEFAKGLPDNLSIMFLTHGDGTLWTNTGQALPSQANINQSQPSEDLGSVLVRKLSQQLDRLERNLGQPRTKTKEPE